MAINKNKPASLSAEEIQTWEASDLRKRKIEKVDIKDDERELTAPFFIVSPDRDTNNKLADSKEQGKSVGVINDLLINSCVLAGDMETLEWNDAVYYGLTKIISEKLVIAKKV